MGMVAGMQPWMVTDGGVVSGKMGNADCFLIRDAEAFH